MSDPRRIDRAEPGFWLIRLVKGGPLVPACIRRVHTTVEPGAPLNSMDRSPFLAAFIAGKPAHLDQVWLRRGTSITEAEYRFRCRDAEWAEENAPSDPAANPGSAIDLGNLPPLF